MILVSNIFVDVCIPLLVIKVHIFRIISLSIVQENRKSMIEIQISVKTSKQDDTTRTHTPKPGYLKLTIKKLPSLYGTVYRNTVRCPYLVFQKKLREQIHLIVT
jgi:hypothetical protein